MTRGQILTPRGIVEGAVRISRGRIAAVRAKAPKQAVGISLRGGYLAPGFIDLHIWGDPQRVSREAVSRGTTAFLSAIGPDRRERLISRLRQLPSSRSLEGAQCLGAHLEGPFLSRSRSGALPGRWMRSPTARELEMLAEAGGKRLKLVTMAPELPGAIEAIRWWAKRRVSVSLGHSEATSERALRAVAAGARAVTHVFNGMPRFHHRRPSLLDVALTEPRLTAMVIADGIHISPLAFRLLVQAKGPDGVVLVTDSLRYQSGEAEARGGAYYTRRDLLAGSRLTMIQAVQNAVAFGQVSLMEAVRMATEIPARLVGLPMRGTLEAGQRADLVGFDHNFRILLTIVGGRVVFSR